MKKILALILFMVSLSVQAQTVHKWNKELNEMCSEYASANHTPRELYNCLIENTRDYYIWRHGWEQPVEANVMGIIAIYQPEIINLPLIEKQQLADYYNKSLPQMYREKMNKRQNLDAKFTQTDIDRIWNAKL